MVKDKDARQQALRDLIDASGMTQQQAANHIGVSRKAVEHWLGGRRRVPEYALKAMRRRA